MFLQNGQPPVDVLQGVLDGLRQAIVISDEDGSVRFANRATLDLLRRRRARPKFSSVGDLFSILGPFRHFDGRVADEQDLPCACPDDEVPADSLDLLAVDKWEEARPALSFSGFRVKDQASGNPLRVLVIEDVSHRYERDSILRTTFEQGPVPVTLVNRRDGCVLDANPAFLELLGYEREQVVGRLVSDLDLIVNSEVMPAVTERLDSGEPVDSLELVVRGRDQSVHTVLCWVRCLQVSGQECVLTVYVDVTKQKEMERRMSEATEVVLESASVFSRSVVQQLEKLRAPDRGRAVSGELELLTKREREVVSRVGAGQSNLRIAGELSLTPQTVRNYVTRIYRKIGVTNRAEAVVWARERGLVKA
jgi:PAS domain S-box-containing protein